MSDPVSNVEIEDVLSSIRRLVSNEERDKAAGNAAADDREDATDKLVLTPSLRVDESAAPATDPGAPPADAGATPAATGDDPEAALPDDAPDAADHASEDAGHDVDAPPADAVEAHEDDTASDHPLADIGSEAAEPETLGEVLEAATDMPSPDATAAEESENPDAAPFEDAVDNEELQQRVAAFEAAIAARDDHWEPDGQSEDAYSGGNVEPLPWSDTTAAPAADHDTPRDAADTDTDTGPFAEDGGTAEPGPSGTTATDAPADGRHDTERGADETAFEYLDDTLIDEEALRDMVSELVRQELQGALGERITRNVRKLVRREIHRALTSQQFD
ncbi:hypothetical protein [Roseovarius sp. SYSU LYC5161]|uniref:hypothetical protein n=1 Tax=Roseovarius halophilus (ex Wu et al. 2025) TaxID=3376060 RepID=UPI00399A5D23